MENNGETKTDATAIMRPTAYISLLRFSDGSELRLEANEKIIIVGANNSGKSQSLREIVQHLQQNNFQDGIVVKHVEVIKSGSLSDLQRYIDENGTRINEVYTIGDWHFNMHSIHQWNQPGIRDSLFRGFVKFIDATERLVICRHQENIPHDQPPTKPQHVLYRSKTLTEKISAIFKKAFGRDLFINHLGGSTIPIHVGIKPDSSLDPFGDECRSHVLSQPLLEKQGDGMKSYAGILLETIVSPKDITLLDEPEAFLHPPQMRKLGETLANHVTSQIIVATHSSDVLRGFLEAMKGEVRVIRIRREGDVNHVFEATPQAIKQLWERPALRYSNALEGIFHEETVICENESDCRLINAIADHLSASDIGAWKDTAYIPAGGKHGIPKIARTLREVGAPVKAVFDADALSDSGLLREIVESFGGDWGNFESDWRQIDQSLRTSHTPKSAAEVKNAISTLLDASEPEVVPKKDIENALKFNNHWSRFKQDGIRGLPKGSIRTVAARLIGGLSQIGIYIIPIGEIENFCPELGLHGPAYVTKLLESCDLASDELGDLRAFVRHVHMGSSGIVSIESATVQE